MVATDHLDVRGRRIGTADPIVESSTGRGSTILAGAGATWGACSGVPAQPVAPATRISVTDQPTARDHRTGLVRRRMTSVLISPTITDAPGKRLIVTFHRRGHNLGDDHE